MGYDCSTVEFPADIAHIHEAYKTIAYDDPTRDDWAELFWQTAFARGLHFARSYTTFSDLRETMTQLGMTFDPKFDTHAAWVREPAEVIALIDEGREDHPLVVAYEQRLDRECLGRRFEHPGIPIFKISSGSDGWIVYPDEIMSALRLYEDNGGRESVVLLWRQSTYDIQLWDEWIRFLRTAAELGGFRVR